MLERLNKNNLNNDGSILVGYLWDVSFDGKIYKDDWKEIYKMPIVKEYLKQYITETYDIPGGRDILWEDGKKSDLVLVYRKK